jgi:hypothetical protein
VAAVALTAIAKVEKNRPIRTLALRMLVAPWWRLIRRMKAAA